MPEEPQANETTEPGRILRNYQNNRLVIIVERSTRVFGSHRSNDTFFVAERWEYTTSDTSLGHRSYSQLPSPQNVQLLPKFRTLAFPDTDVQDYLAAIFFADDLTIVLGQQSMNVFS